jgi:hypothetical protein
MSSRDVSERCSNAFACEARSRRERKQNKSHIILDDELRGADFASKDPFEEGSGRLEKKC